MNKTRKYILKRRKNYKKRKNTRRIKKGGTSVFKFFRTPKIGVIEKKYKVINETTFDENFWKNNFILMFNTSPEGKYKNKGDVLFEKRILTRPGYESEYERKMDNDDIEFLVNGRINYYENHDRAQDLADDFYTLSYVLLMNNHEYSIFQNFPNNIAFQIPKKHFSNSDSSQSMIINDNNGSTPTLMQSRLNRRKYPSPIVDDF